MIESSAVVDRNAEIEEGVSIGAFSIIGSDVQIGKGTVIGPHVVIKGPTILGEDNRIFQSHRFKILDVRTSFSKN